MAFFDRDCAKKMVSFFFFEGERGVDTNTQSLQIVLIYHLLKLAVFFFFLLLFPASSCEDSSQDNHISLTLVVMCKYCSSTLAKLAELLWTSFRQEISSETLRPTYCNQPSPNQLFKCALTLIFDVSKYVSDL